MKYDEFEAYKSSRVATIKLLAECYDKLQARAIFNTLQLIWGTELSLDDEDKLFEIYCKECELITKIEEASI